MENNEIYGLVILAILAVGVSAYLLVSIARRRCPKCKTKWAMTTTGKTKDGRWLRAQTFVVAGKDWKNGNARLADIATGGSQFTVAVAVLEVEIAVFQSGQYEDRSVRNSGWTTGDWDGDGDFTAGDLVLAFQDGGYERGPRMQSRSPRRLL